MSCAEIEGARATWTSRRAYREPAHNRPTVIGAKGYRSARLDHGSIGMYQIPGEKMATLG